MKKPTHNCKMTCMIKISMNTENLPKSKLEKAFNILIVLFLCVGISALLVGVENLSFYHYNDMGNVFMTVSVFAILIGLFI